MSTSFALRTRAIWSGIAVALLLLHGCSPMLVRSKERGTTTGAILVGSPKVLSRETLFNDRVREAAWLRKTLDASDEESVTDLQGLTESNRYSGLEVGLKAQVGPQIKVVTSGLKNQLDATHQKQAEDALDHNIRMAQKRAKLAKVQAGEVVDESAASSNAAVPADVSTSGADSATKPSDDGKSDGKTDGKTNATTADKSATEAEKSVSGALDNLKAMRELLGSSKDMAPGKAGTSAVDRFRSRIALREEIRGELHETELDDRHQLLGSTLYRLKFDATLFPAHDTEAWAVVEYQIVEPVFDFDRMRKGFESALKLRIEEEAYLLRDLALAHSIEELPDYFVERMLQAANKHYGAPVREAPMHRRYSQGMAQIQRVAPKPGAPNEPDAPPPPKHACASACELVAIIDAKTKDETDKPGARRAFLDEWIRQALEDQYTQDEELAKIATVSVAKGYPYVVKVKAISPAFEDLLKSQTANVYGYAATPKEMVQRISQAASDRNASRLSFDLGVLGGSVGGDVGVSRIVQSEQLAQALRQQPLVVGYTVSHVKRETDKAIIADDVLGRFGWIQGPRFELEDTNRMTGKTAWRFRHKVVQNSLAAAIVVPAWWDRIRLRPCTAWVPVHAQMNESSPCARDAADAREKDAKPNATLWKELEVPVKANYLSILELFSNRLMPQPVWTSPSTSNKDEPVVVGEPADIAVYGWNLWRNSVVTLGAQRADEVYVLPDGQGLIAHFEAVQDHGSDQAVVERGVSVWTSHGSAGAKSVYVRRKGEAAKPPEGDAKPLTTALAPQLVVTRNQTYAMVITHGALPAERKRVRIEVKTGQADWAEVKRAGIKVGPLPDCGKDRVCFELVPEDPNNKSWPANGHALQSRMLIEAVSGDILTLVSTSQPYYQENGVAQGIEAMARREDAGKPESVSISLVFPVAFQAIKPEFDPGKLKLTGANDSWKKAASCKRPSDGKWISADGKIRCLTSVILADANATKVSFKVTGSQDEELGLDAIINLDIAK